MALLNFQPGVKVKLLTNATFSTTGYGGGYGGGGVIEEIVGSVDLLAGLQAFYNLSDLSDSSVYRRSLTNVGNVLFTSGNSGKIGKCAIFDGTDKVLKNESISLAGSTELTLSFWVRTSNFSQPGCNLVGIWGNNNSSDTQFEAYYESSSVVGLVQTPSGQGDRGMLTAPSSMSIADGNWHHFVFIFKDGNKVYGIYDGVKTSINKYSSTAISNNISYFGIGRTSQTLWDGVNHFDGMIDAVGVWNRALSDAEVSALYNYGSGKEITRLTTGLQAFYNLSDTSDSSGNGKTLTNVGGITFGSGKLGNAALINADGHSGGKYFITNVSGAIGNGFTYSTWAKYNSGTRGGALVQSVTGDFAGWFIGISDAGELAYLAGKGSGWVISDHFTTIAPDEWHHIVKVADSNGTKIYVNGQLVGTWANNSWSSANIEIGHYAYHYGNQDWSWNGQIDAVGIWSRALSNTEVAALYNSGNGVELV